MVGKYPPAERKKKAYTSQMSEANHMAGQALKRAMRSADVSGLQLSQAIKCSPQSVSNWTLRGVPAGKAHHVAQVLHCDPGEICPGLSGHSKNASPGAGLHEYKVSDNAMAPLILKNDIVIVDTKSTGLVPDLIYAARASGDDAVVIRRLDSSSTPARLIPENSHFPAVTDFEIIGRAVSFSHVFE